jgi:deazaflavin-dependent oxidoreductase (nitroreductase family)
MIRDEFWNRMKNVQKIHRFLYGIGLGAVIGKIILLLTTTGRKSGQKRVTPLQYEQMDGNFYLGSARGTKADWYRNIAANARVEVRVKNRHFMADAEPVTDPVRIADFLEIRLQRHPSMVGLLMQKVYHLPKRPSREQLLELAAAQAMVILRPLQEL